MKIKQNIKFVTKNDLCTGCGVCKSSCPFDAITIVDKDGCFRPVIDDKICKNDMGCNKCFVTCPGHSIDLQKVASGLYSDVCEDPLMGRYYKCFTGFSTDFDIRYHSASGGLVSQFLIYLLEKGLIDGAVVTRFEKESPLKVKTFIATCKEDIISARSSKYGPVHFGDVIQEVVDAPGKNYVFVGLPCHIEGLRKFAQLNKTFASKVKGYFALFCSSGRSYNLTEYVCKERGFSSNDLQNFAYRDNGCLGNMVAKYNKNGEESTWEEPFKRYYQSLASFFVPTRCKVCIDHYGELADICFGDVHIEPYSKDTIGTNSVIIRSKEWWSLFQRMVDDGYVQIEEVSADLVNKSQPMAKVKKTRNISFLTIRKKMGMEVPYFGVDLHQNVSLKNYIWYFKTISQQLIGFNKKLWWIIPLFKLKKRPHNLLNNRK